MIKEQQKYFFPFQLSLDFFSVYIAYVVASPLALSFAKAVHHKESPFFSDFSSIASVHSLPLLFLMPLILLSLFRSYSFIGIPRRQTAIVHTGGACIITAVIFLIYHFQFPYAPAQFAITFFWFLSAWTLLAFNRVLMIFFLKIKNKKRNSQFLLIIGSDAVSAHIANLFAANPAWGFTVVGFLSDSQNDKNVGINGYPVLGRLQDFDNVVEKHIVDCVLFAQETADLTQIRSFAQRCNSRGINFSYTAPLPDMFPGDIIAERIGNIPVVFHKFVAHSPEKLFVKRLIDIALSLLFIIGLGPLWLIIPIIIKKDSPGPAFFNQERMGKNGRRFRMFKFRSMVVGADKMQEQLLHLNEMDGPVFKINNDPRFTRLGKFLRRSSIDELPQLFNVLRGDMSLVGPRPPVLKEVMQYAAWQRKRLSITPGITCLWQVTGRNTIRFEEWMQLDLQYIDNWSLTLDFKILLKTALAVLSRKGAA